MKLKLTYQPEEAQEADLILHFVRGLSPGAKVRQDKSKAPKLAVYLTTKERNAKNGSETFTNVRPEGNQENANPYC